MNGGPRRTPEQRLIERRSVAPTGCWEWSGYHAKTGYGTMAFGGKPEYVHRVSWEVFRGPIPIGLQIDHLCRNRSCFNPDHLEPVPQAENIRRGEGVSGINARKTHCQKGHEFTPENTYLSRGFRSCRTCVLAKQAVQRRARRVDPDSPRTEIEIWTDGEPR